MRTKSRMISLRISEEEYDRLRALHTVDGSRNVSAVVRDAVRGLISQPAKIEEMDRKLNLLVETVERLSRLVEPVEA